MGRGRRGARSPGRCSVRRSAVENLQERRAQFVEALALQTDFAKSAYEDFVAEATKIGELYSSIAKEVFKPIESATKTFTAAE
jgi:hypothetical protein